MKPSTIVIADSQNLYRIGLKSVIKKHFKNAQIRETNTKKDVLKWLKKEEINYLFLDPYNIKNFEIEEINTLNLAYPNCKIIIITCSHNELSEELLIRKIIKGYICKTNKELIFHEAISKIEENEEYVCNEILSKFFKNKVKNKCKAQYQLTERETEILKLIGQGKSGEQIANELFISIHTFRTHRKNIMKKTNINSTSKLVVHAISNHLG